VTASPAVHDGLVVVQTDTVVRAFDTAGEELWAVNLPDQNPWRPAPAVDDSRVYVSRGTTTEALTRDGKPDWTYERNTEAQYPPTVAGDAVLVSEDGAVTALDRTDGTRLWRADTDGRGEVITVGNALLLTDSSSVTALGT